MAIYLAQTLEHLARQGVNITIESSHYLPDTLINLARIAKGSGAHITISGSYLPMTLEQLGLIAGNQLTVIVSKEK